MDLEKDDFYSNLHDINDQCKKYLYYHIVLTMADGSKMDGIIEDVDADYIIMLVGEEVIEGDGENQSDQKRQYYDNNRPRRRFRHFRRRRFPIAQLTALSLLPYIAPPLYPYYSYYPYY